MKRPTPILIATAILTFALSVSRAAETPEPGHVDFGTFSRAAGGEFVEVNLSGAVLSLAARFVPKEEADVAKLVSGLQEVRVNVIGLNDENRDEITNRIQRIRTTLAEQGWERIVSVQDKADDVGIYLKTLGKDAIAGLTIVVMDGKKEAVFVNIVGNIKVEQLAVLGDRLNIDPLKKIGRRAEKQKQATGEN